MMTILTCMADSITPGDYIRCFNEIPLISFWTIVYVGLVILSVAKFYSIFRSSLGKSLSLSGFMTFLAGLGLFIAELLNPYYLTLSLTLMVVGLFLSIAKT